MSLSCFSLSANSSVRRWISKSYANLKRLYDAQREQLSDASVEIKAYTQGLKKVEAQLVAHQQGQLWYEQKIKFMKIDLDDKTDVLTYHKKLLAKAQKEKDDLEVIVDKWNHSSKNLGKIVNHHMSARDKFGLGYGDYRYSGNLSYENEVFQSVFKSNKGDFENPPLQKTCEMQAVPPPMTGNYLPSGPDIEIDDSQYTYGPEKTQPSESESQTTELDTCNSNISTEPSELVSEPVVNESNIEVQPKVWSDAPIIEEYESDSDDECVTVQTKGLDTPSFANKQVKTPRENVKNQSTHSQKPKVNNKELGHGFTERACFVCGSFSHLIRDCDYHVKLAKQVELNKQNMSKGNGTRERKPTWNNVQRVNKQNQFVPLAVQTRTGNNPVNTAKASSTNNFSTARQNVNRQTVLTSTALKVNTVKPIVNGVRPANVFHKTHSPSSRPFKRTTVLRTNFSNQKVYTAKVKEVSTVGGKWDTADNPHRTLKNKGIIDSGCSRHMTGNKAYLADFQDFNGGPVAFGGSKGYITGKGKIKTGKLDFEDVSFVKELQHFNLFSVSQMCDKKNKVLFTDSECLVLSPDFKLPDENQILLKVPRQNNMYSFNLENIVPLGGLACLIAKATTDESNKWHRRLGHVNFKNLNRLVKGNLVRGLPTKLFPKWTTLVVAVKKGKHHKSFAARTTPSTNEGLPVSNTTNSQKRTMKYLQLEVYFHEDATDGYRTSGGIGIEKMKKRSGVRNKARLFAQWTHKKEGIDYEDELQVLGNATLSTFLLENGYRKRDNIQNSLPEEKNKHKHLVQVYVDDIIYGSIKEVLGDKYVDEILKKFDFANVKSASTPIETQKPLVKDEEASDVDVHLYRSMIGSLMYVTASRPDIMFAVCACSRFQVTPKTSHLSAVKRIFRYLKGKPKLGLWYPRESSFDLESYSDSDYAGANLDRKSTTGGCQFLGRRLITWQCKKQTIVATSTTEAEYVAAASCCGQVLWIQNQMLDYGFNFMNTKIYIDNESTICIVKNPVYHSKTKHIAIRHHFIRDAYEKKLIQVLKIHTNDNVADLLTKAFDSKKIAQVVSALIKSVVQPTKRRVYVMFDNKGDAYHWRGVYQVKLDSMVDDEGRLHFWCMDTYWLEVMLVNALRRFRESLRRVTDGAEAFLILNFVLLTLDKVCIDPCKVCTAWAKFGGVTAKERLEKNNARVQTLISLTDDHSLLSKMAALESCPKHNMIAYLEKTEGNVEFHEVIDFLRRSYIYHALTVSPIVSTTFVEQFWTSAKSKTINNVRHITAKVAGKHVSISEASIRTDLIFDDADGIDTLPNQAIFDAIQRMGYEGDLTVLTFNKALFSPQWRQSKDLFTHPIVPDSIPEPTGENLGDHSSNDTSLLGNEDDMTLPNVYDLCYIFMSSGLDQRKEIKLLKAQYHQASRASETCHSNFQRIFLKTVSLQAKTLKEGSQRKQRMHDKYVSKQGGDWKDESSVQRLIKQIEGADDQVEGSEEIFESTKEQRPGTEEKVESTVGQIEGTEDQSKEEIATPASQTPTSIIFGDDETIATLLINMSQAKAASKKKRKSWQKVQEMEAEEERNRLAEEEATNEALIKNFDDIKARIEADRILAEKLQEQEREQFTIEERAKFLHDTIAAQRKFLAQQRSEAIRNRPPTKNQLRNQMMTYLKHVGNFKHSELKSKKFEDIQAMYEKIKRSDEDFIAIGSVEDESLIKRMNKKDSSKVEEIKQESKEEVKEEDKDEENTRKRKQGTRKKMKSRKRRFKQDTSQMTHLTTKKKMMELRLCLTPSSFDESKRLEEINLNVVTRSNGQKRYFSTLMRVLSVFDREDLDAVYKLVGMNLLFKIRVPKVGSCTVLGVPHFDDINEGLVHSHANSEKKYPLKKNLKNKMMKVKKGLGVG
ncbi:ribonuclease H-like domain-containing protein [Tanacetum coccineum]